MINRLIDMDIKVLNPTKLTNNGKYSIEEYAYIFLEGLGKTQKDRFKQMLENGIKSGMSVAKSYGIDYEEFITEVKRQLQIN